MRRCWTCCAVIYSFLLGIGAITAQQASPRTVRSIRFRVISTNSKPLPGISMDEFAANMKSRGIDFAVERKFDPIAVEKAADVLRKLYSGAGQEVRVEHTVSAIPPRSVEVSFEIIQLCACR